VADLWYVACVRRTHATYQRSATSSCCLCIVLMLIVSALLKVAEVDDLFVSTQHPLMSLAQAAINLCAISTPKTPISLTLSTSATCRTTPLFLEARESAKEHARNISHSLAHHTFAAPTVRFISVLSLCS